MRDTLQHFVFARPTAFPVLGHGGGPLWYGFLAQGGVRAVRSPHDADLMVLAGGIPPAWHDRLRALFETFALPRAALWLRPTAEEAEEDEAGDAADASPSTAIPLAASLSPGAQPDRHALRNALLAPGTKANRALLPDEPPTPWRGKGDHGQGGEGMMGGTPYGRPMAMTGPDPFDDLMLGSLPTALGPHFPGLPSGLCLTLELQGDRIMSVQAVDNAFPAQPAAPETAGATLAPSIRALAGKAVPVAALEKARLAGHLAWMADMLPLLGMAALGQAAGRLIARLPEGAAGEVAIARLIRRAERAGLRRLTAGLGVVDRERVAALGLRGPIARAAGVNDDARRDDPAYAGLADEGPGFAVAVEAGGDAWARWRVRARESLQAARLLTRAGERRATAAEGPHGRLVRAAEHPVGPSRAALDLLPDLLTGREWSEAVTIIASLDLDPAEAALQ